MKKQKKIHKDHHPQPKMETKSKSVSIFSKVPIVITAIVIVGNGFFSTMGENIYNSTMDWYNRPQINIFYSGLLPKGNYCSEVINIENVGRSKIEELTIRFTVPLNTRIISKDIETNSQSPINYGAYQIHQFPHNQLDQNARLQMTTLYEVNRIRFANALRTAGRVEHSIPKIEITSKNGERIIWDGEGEHACAKKIDQLDNDGYFGKKIDLNRNEEIPPANIE